MKKSKVFYFIKYLFLSIFLSLGLYFFIQNYIPDAFTALYREHKNESSNWTIYLPPSYGSYFKNSGFANLSKSERQFMESYMPIIVNRAHIVGDYCSVHSELVFPMVPGMEMSWITRKNNPNIIWCWNFKVGTGTWTTNFLREGHFNEYNPKILALPPSEREEAKYSEYYGGDIYAIAKVFPEPETQEDKSEVFKNAIRFLTVRHPFVRVLSGYRNIMAMSVPSLEQDGFYPSVRKQIIDSYRPMNSTNADPFPTYPEFINYFINATKDFKTSEKWYTWNRRLRDYWEPFWSHCNICSSDYNVFIKLESMDVEEKFVAILANLVEVKTRKWREWKHVINGTTSNKVAEKYYKQLSHQQMLDLYDIYKHDFQMFNYNIEDYLKLV